MTIVKGSLAVNVSCPEVEVLPATVVSSSTSELPLNLRLRVSEPAKSFSMLSNARPQGVREAAAEDSPAMKQAACMKVSCEVDLADEEGLSCVPMSLQCGFEAKEAVWASQWATVSSDHLILCAAATVTAYLDRCWEEINNMRLQYIL